MGKTVKQSRSVSTAASVAGMRPEAPGTRSELSRVMALHWLDALDEKFNNIVCIALGALAHQETRADEYKDEIMCSLLRIIQEQADDSVKFGNELRVMLETLPEEAKHG